jgi:cyclopropane-fatty-acyl-phospholipid synthase
MRVLDVGCGWGSFARHAAERYGARVVGVTVSRRQVELAREICRGLPVEIHLQDYRDVTGPFDRLVSIGMFEHVGLKNHRTYVQVAQRALADDGLFLLQTIGGASSRRVPDPWVSRYVFPNSLVPSARQLAAAIEGLFVVEDWHNFGADYDRTLTAWVHNFRSAWPELERRYGERFFRMWTYYLLSSAGAFRARRNQLWQIVLSKRGVPGGYVPVR